MPNNFSVQLGEPGGPISAPVLQTGPSPLDPILSTISSGLSQFKNDMDERARKKKAEAEEEAKRQERNAEWDFFGNLVVRDETLGAEHSRDPLLDLVRGPSLGVTGPGAGNPETPVGTLDPATAIIEGAVAAGAADGESVANASADAEAMIDEYETMNTAVQQGNVPEAAREATVERMIMNMRHKYPDLDIDVLLSIMEKTGIKSSLFRYIQNEQKNFEGQENARRESMEKAFTRGQEILGPKAASMPQDQVTAAGWQDIQNEMVLERTMANLDIQTKQANLSEKQIAMQEREAATTIRSVMSQQFFNQMSPYISSVNELIRAMPEAGSNPALEENFQIAMDELKQQAEIAKESLIAKVMASGNPNAAEIASQLRTQFDEMYTNTILTPLENRDKRTANLLEKLEKNLGLKMTQAYPFISGMKRLGVSMQLTDLLIETASPEVRERLAGEIANLSNFNMYDLGQRSSAMLQMTEIISILKGNKTLNQLDITPQQAGGVIRQVKGVVEELRLDVARGDYDEANSYLNGLAELSVAAGELSPGSSLNSLQGAANALSGRNIGALRNLVSGKAEGVDPEYARTVALGARSAAANVYTGLMSKGRNFGQYQVVYNERSLQWELKKGPPKVSPELAQRPGYTPRDAPVPTEAKTLVTTLNNAQAFLVETAELDETAMKAKNKRELSLWYTQGKVPESVAAQMQKEQKNAAGPADVLRAIEKLREDVRANGLDFDVPSILNADGVPVDAQGKVVVSEVTSRMNDAAISAGLSNFVAAGILANAQHESGFDPSVGGDKDKNGNPTAFGFFQHRKERVENFKEVTGVHPRNASPEQAIQFFVWELDNPQEAGMTQAQADAIRNAGSAQEAAMLIQKYYERPKKVDPKRGRTANGFYKQYYSE